MELVVFFFTIFRNQYKYSRVSFCDGTFYDDSLSRHLSSRNEHSRLVVHHFLYLARFQLFSNVHVFLLFVFWCSSFKLIVIFSIHDVHQKDSKEEKIKTADVKFFLDVF